jgi:6-pyruvoyltetrahydropterin/6-carboxytetrahydropterin synthase
MITAERYHDISCGHRVHGHEGKCALLHGHNYRITFICRAAPQSLGMYPNVRIAQPGVDGIGRVIDFSAIKARLCMWTEENWDHRFLAWEADVVMRNLVNLMEAHNAARMLDESVVWVPFNPTAENMARYLVEVVGPQQLAGTGVELVEVIVEETRKCSASFMKDGA